MAFPALAAAPTLSSRSSNAVDDSVSLPASIAAGDLIIVVHAADGALTRTWPGSWQEIKDAQIASGNGNIGVAYLIASGGETSVTVSKSATERFTAFAFRIPSGSWHGTTPPEISTGVTGSSASPDPDSLSPSWGAEDTLFVALCCWDNSSGGNAVTAWPSNYSGNQTQSDDVSSAARCAMATRELNASSDDAPAFTITSDEWWAGLLAIRPAGGGGGGAKPWLYRPHTHTVGHGQRRAG